MKRTIVLGGVAIVTTLVLFLSATSSLGQGADMDADGILDEFDNCIETPNGTLLGQIDVNNPYYRIQLDADEDGYGNACDYDYNNDGAVGIDDFSSLLTLICESGFGIYAQWDNDRNGGVGLTEVSEYLLYISTAPGPSGLACAAANVKGSCAPVVSW